VLHGLVALVVMVSKVAINHGLHLKQQACMRNDRLTFEMMGPYVKWQAHVETMGSHTKWQAHIETMDLHVRWGADVGIVKGNPGVHGGFLLLAM